MKKREYLTIEKLRVIHESINYLDTYEGDPESDHHIGPNINSEEMKYTEALRELGRINKRRKVLIEILTKG